MEFKAKTEREWQAEVNKLRAEKSTIKGWFIFLAFFMLLCWMCDHHRGDGDTTYDQDPESSLSVIQPINV